MTITSVSKPILFDHVKGKIYGSNELVAYKKENRAWVKTNEKFYRFQNLKVVPNAWGLNSYSAGDCVTYQNRYFMCIRSNNGNDTPVVFNDDSVNKAFWHEYTYLFDNITGAAVLGEYEDYYNYCLYSEDLSKGVSKSDIESKTTGRKKLTGKELEKFISQIDKARAEYYEYHTGHVWTDALNYDLCLDSGKITEVEPLECFLGVLCWLRDVKSV